MIGQQAIEFGEKKRKIRAKTQLKVIEIGINRKAVCDFLLVINSNRHFLYRFGVIAAYCSNLRHCIFSPLWGLWDNVRCSSWAHWIARSELHISVNWTFFRQVLRKFTAEALRAKIDRKSAISLQSGNFDPQFQVEGIAPTNHSFV